MENNNSNKKRTLILMIVAVTVFVALIVGATYAYYSVNASGSNAKTTITAQTEGGGSIVLTTPVTGLKLELLGDEMDENNKNKEYYATTKDDPKGYADSLESGTHNIANIAVASSTEGSKYDCSANVKITLNIADDTQMGNVLQKDDLLLSIIGYKEVDLFDVKEKGGTDTIPVTFTLKSETPTILQLYTKLKNKESNQNYLADKELNITVETQDLKCSVVKPFVTGTGAELAHSKPDGLTDEPVADLYRYIGTNPDNYICFGSSSCTEGTNKDNYLYRIIGITEDGQLKLIKNSSIGANKWHSSFTENAVWDVANGDKKEAELHQKLNESTFLTNNSTQYVPNGWESKIVTTSWKIGDSKTVSSPDGDGIGYGTGKTETGTQVLNWEKETIVTTPSKIGLMYLSDYYFSLDGTGNKNCYKTSSGDYNQCKTSWLHLSNNGDNDTIFYNEWTMSRYGNYSSSSDYYAWVVNSSGSVVNYTLTDTYAVRPVFYLTADSVIKGGTGTSEDPYILESPEETGERIATEKFGKVPTYFNTTPTGDMYRFVGIQDDDKANKINNYVCFGNEKCSEGATDNHLYRIIGITKEGNLKIQKNSAIGIAAWNSQNEQDIKWGDSEMYTSTLKNWYDNISNVSQDMKGKIDTTHTWNTGDINGNTGYSNGTTVYNAEYNNGQSPHTGAVGLAYMSDYYFAYNEQGTQNCNSSSPDYCKSWMIPSDASNGGSVL